MKMAPIGNPSNILQQCGFLPRAKYLIPHCSRDMIVLFHVYDDESFDSNYKLFKNQRGEAFCSLHWSKLQEWTPDEKGSGFQSL